MRLRTYLKILIATAVFITASCTNKEPAVFEFSNADRTWIGPDFWANRLQDWKLEGGQLVCLNETNPMRTVHLLTHNLSDRQGNVDLAVELNMVDLVKGKASAGILIGAGAGQDYRQAALIHHSYGKNGGLYVGIRSDGHLFLRDFETEDTHIAEVTLVSEVFESKVNLTIQINEEGRLTAIAKSESQELGRLEKIPIKADRLIGSIALVSNPDPETKKGRFSFDNWSVSGDKIDFHEDRINGPIIGTQHTLHDNTVKLTAQLMPLAITNKGKAWMELKQGKDWKRIQETEVIRPGYTAHFRSENWDDSENQIYRIGYHLEGKDYYSEGVIKKNPTNKEEVVVAAFTGNHNNVRPNPTRWGGVDTGKFPWDWGLWFPHTDLINNFMQHQPDVLFFSGDQVYEGASPTWADRKNGELDYLYKWYLWYWAFGELTAEIPTITIPDDHDVYHGNIWGAGGRLAKPGALGGTAQDGGGYRMPADWVKMVERTQTSHMPDSFDPTPVEQGIGVYYTDFTYGGVSFAVLEDRKFKSAPRALLPKANVGNGWARNKDFNPKKSADVDGAILLGERQLDFLENWAADWSEKTEMKAVLSQTIFADVVTLPSTEINDANFPGLEIYEKGDYAPDDVPAADMDSNGWPQTGRNKAVKKLRKAFAVHIAGDQHLGSTIQYGVDEYNDAGFALCVPSIANFYPRRWFPKEPGSNRVEGSPIYTGDHEDGFGNKMTVHAVSNPYISNKPPAELHDRAAGYGVARFNKTARTITFENWPRWADPSKGDKPYEGWPVIINQEDNYGREAQGHLPEVRVSGIVDPVIQVYDETDQEIIYTLRIKGNRFVPKVFETTHKYTVTISDYSGSAVVQSFRGLDVQNIETLKVDFN
ncbi:alkaline phosphatase D family protein [Roseivirga sp. E12]|uniref:alkaline phosphatase D family protein n=1 Tax=Roseivirga sp. E12 TaxID=2819237 RepID=UPI001ABCF441|nr:alkaline phosphatase D family protein [Roseivirga sp. E12]MBO3699909.1 alkaline phosphatase D family protein [Roseivirga sp. E12]